MTQASSCCCAVVRARGARWDLARPMRQQDRCDEHAAFMDSLTHERAVVLGGPLGDGEERFLIVMAADGAHEVVARLTRDPWTPLEMLRTASIDRWEIWLNGSR